MVLAVDATTLFKVIEVPDTPVTLPVIQFCGLARFLTEITLPVEISGETMLAEMLTAPLVDGVRLPAT
jgi:hypothetical protein